MQVILELFLCSHDGGSRICFAKGSLDITGRQNDPDRELGPLLESMGVDAGSDRVCAHSTSWRYEDGGILLTYLAWAGAESIPPGLCSRLDLNDAGAPGSKGPLAPRPEHIREADVLAHGLRHLRHLVLKGDPFVTRAVAGTGSLSFFESLSPERAGQIRRAS